MNNRNKGIYTILCSIVIIFGLIKLDIPFHDTETVHHKLSGVARVIITIILLFIVITTLPRAIKNMRTNS